MIDQMPTSEGPVAGQPHARVGIRRCTAVTQCHSWDVSDRCNTIGHGDHEGGKWTGCQWDSLSPGVFYCSRRTGCGGVEC